MTDLYLIFLGSFYDCGTYEELFFIAETFIVGCLLERLCDKKSNNLEKIWRHLKLFE